MTLLAVAALAALFTTGCAGPDHKLGRGFNNTFEIVRMGEMRRTVEQTTVFESPGIGCHRRLRSRLRPYPGSHRPRPVSKWRPSRCRLTTRFSPNISSPNRCSRTATSPAVISDPLFDTDTYTGFSGGDIAPFIPGSRFTIFEN